MKFICTLKYKTALDTRVEIDTQLVSQKKRTGF